MSRNYTGLGRYEELFDQLDAAISRLESRCDKIERRVTNLPASNATYAQQACYDSRREIRTRPLPEPPPRRRRTCWDPPLYEQPLYSSFSRGNSSNYDTDPYQQPTRLRPCHEQPPGWPPPPPHRPSCWDPPRKRTNHCCPPPYIGSDSYVQPQNSYARYRSWQPQYQPRSAPKVEDPINAKLDHFLEALDGMETGADATYRRVSKFQSSPQRDLDQPDVSPQLRKIEYPPSRNFIASFAPSGLSPNDSSAPLRHRTKSDQTPTHQPSCWESPLTDTPAADQLHHHYQPPPPQPRSDRQPQQPSTAPPLELLPYSATGYSQPLHPLPVTAPLLASTRHSHVVVPSSRIKEWQMNLQNADEYGLINKAVSCSHDVVWKNTIVEDKWKKNEIGPKGLVGIKDGEDSDIFKMIKMITVRTFDPGICVGFSKQKREFLAMQMAKTDPCDSEKELPHEGVIKCLFFTGTFRIELHMPANHVVFPNAREFNGDDEGRRSVVRCAFDPGGDASPNILLSTLVIASWFPP